MNNIIDGSAMQYLNGFLFGAGFVTAAVIFKLLLHVSACG